MSILRTAPSVYKSNPVFTCFQPWATLLAMGAKHFETTRLPADPALLNKRMLISASSNPSRVEINGPTRTCMAESLASMSLSLDALPTGAIVGTAFLRGCYQIKDRDAGMVELGERVPGSDPQLTRIALSYPQRIFTVLQPDRWLWQFSDAAVFMAQWEVGTVKITSGHVGGSKHMFIVWDGGPDVFVHHLVIPNGVVLHTGDVVRFRAARGAKGYRAVELRFDDAHLQSFQAVAA